MNSWKLILATVVIFGAGVVIGGMIVNFAGHPIAKTSHHAPAATTNTNRPPVERALETNKAHQPELLSQQFVQQLDDVLQLTVVQREAIQKIISCGQEQNHAIWTNCAAQSRQVLQEVRQHIREQLNADQVKQFEKLLKQAHPAGRKAAGTVTNSIPALSPATNAPSQLATNLAGM